MSKTVRTAEDTKWRKDSIHIAIAVVLYFLFRFVILTPSETSGLTELGMKVLALFIPVCYLWCTVDILWPSIAAGVVLVLDNVMSYSAVMSTLFGHYFVCMTIMMSLIVDSMLQTGLLRRVAQWIVSRAVVHKRPYLFYLFFCVAALVIAILIGYINCAIIMMALSREISASLGIDRKHPFHRSMISSIMAIAIVGESAWPFSKAVDTIAYNLLLGAGIETTMLDFFKIGIVFALASLILVPLSLKLFMKPDVSVYDNYDDAAMRAELKASPWTKRQIASGLLFLCSFIMVSCSGLFPNIPFFTKTGIAVPSMLFAVLGGLIRIDKKPLVDWAGGIQRAPWRNALFLGGCFLFVGCFTGADYGISKYFAYLLKPISSGLPPIALIIVAGITATVLTNFMSNAVVCVACFSAFIPALIQTGVGSNYVITCAVLIAFLANSGMSTPAGSSCTAYCVGPNGDMTVGSALKFNVIMAVEYTILAFVVLLPWGLWVV